MRILTVGITTLATVASLAAPRPISVAEAYSRLTAAAEKTVATGRFVATLQSTTTEGSRQPVSYRSTLDHALGGFRIDTWVDTPLRQTIVADTKRVWRYDAVKNEYAYMAQPADIKAAFGIASAWMRNETQRFIRLFAVGVRWMIQPDCFYDDVTGKLEMNQLTQTGNQWRGTLAAFWIDPDPAKGWINAMRIDERIDIPKSGLRVVAMDVTVDYQPGPPLSPFSFIIPKGAKPAMDMPNRGG